MREYCAEQLIKRKNTKRTMFLKLLLIMGAIATVPMVLFSPFFILAPILLVLLTFSIFKITNVEYEYAFFNGEFDIDMIKVKQYRKHLASIDFHNVEVVAPTGSLELQQYRKVKAYNYSSRRKGAKTYQVVANQKGKRVRIIFEPNEAIITEMKLTAPRRVYF